jgi:hypothetical protein
MSRKSKKRTAKISFVLNDSIALEALILNRLATLPASRKNGWLQSLLVRGFCEECAEIQALQQGSNDNSRYIPKMSPTTQAAGHEKAAAPAQKARNKPDTADRTTDEPVALSSLKAVVG